MLVATAGHVDHGKTALIRRLTGVETDRLPEEKRRGLTIDLGFAYRPLAENKVFFGNGTAQTKKRRIFAPLLMNSVLSGA